MTANEGNEMTKASVWLVATALVSLLSSPPGLAAQEKRGAEVVVTKTNGSLYRGELIAVRPDSLLLLGPGGKDTSIGLADIGIVRIVRRSPTGLLTLAGFLLGSGIVGMTSEPLDEWGWTHAALAGIGGAIGGLVSGAISAKDRSFYSWGKPDGALSHNLDKLRGLSREGRSQDRSGSARRSRFRIGLATTMGSFNDRWRSQITDTLWRFAEDVPAEEAGPWVTPFYLSHSPYGELASLGPLSLGYEFTERWIAEIELSMWGRSLKTNASVYPYFASASDGSTYQAYVNDSLRVGYDTVLIGAAYRPVVPSFGRQSAVEIGISAGPAWVKVEPAGSFMPAEKKTVLAAQARVAYDHYFTPSFFLGVYGAVRYSEASFAPATVTRELTFTDWNSWQDPAEPITRLVEMKIPAREFSKTGFAYGLRIGFRI
jgi:hypothetical protein